MATVNKSEKKNLLMLIAMTFEENNTDKQWKNCYLNLLSSVYLLLYWHININGNTLLSQRQAWWSNSHIISHYTNYANNQTVNTAPLTVQMLDLSCCDGWGNSETCNMSFVSFMSFLMCILYNRSLCSISSLSPVKKHIYHSLYCTKTHNSVDRELTPPCWSRIILNISVPKSWVWDRCLRLLGQWCLTFYHLKLW